MVVTERPVRVEKALSLRGDAILLMASLLVWKKFPKLPSPQIN